MRKFNDKQCIICNNTYTPLGSSSKYCTKECSDIAVRQKQPEYSRRYLEKKGVNVGVGSGGMTKSGMENPNYKNGIGIFAKMRSEIRNNVRYCERCSKDLKYASKYHWCVHHKDHDRTNNNMDNFELLCKRCHQVEHNCLSALEGVETKIVRDKRTGRYKRIEAPDNQMVDEIVHSA